MRASTAIIRVSTVFAVCAVLQACAGANEQEDGAAPLTWETVWSDDFDGAALDLTKWSAEESCWGGGNNERQCYTGRTENVRIEDGNLVLSAIPEIHTGPLFPAHYENLANDETREQSYTSGKVITHGKADWTYGRISARIKLPSGQGAWPAFWMLPADNIYGGWPLSGEIDIMEAVNLGAVCDECAGGQERRTSGAIHFGGQIPKNTYLYFKTEHAGGSAPTEQWCIYSVEWAEGVIQWFIDGKIVMRLESDDWYTEGDDAKGRMAAPFDHPFYLNLNLAIGGNLAESQNAGGVDRAIFPAEMLVDWVRVEQCANDLETGLACLSNQEWNGRPLGPADNHAP